MRTRRFQLSALAVVLAGATLVACGDDDDESASDTAAQDTVSEQAESETETDDAELDEAVEDGETITVTLDDYEFRDLPQTVAAGTKLSVTNVAESELHELVAFRLPDDEDRSVEELVNLPPEEFGPLMGSLGQPATVLLATPGGPEIPAVGDGTLSEPGRYAIFCMIPIGIEPDVYLQAAQDSGGEAPQIEGAGAPHITAGMYTELVVE